MNPHRIVRTWFRAPPFREGVWAGAVVALAILAAVALLVSSR